MTDYDYSEPREENGEPRDLFDVVAAPVVEATPADAPAGDPIPVPDPDTDTRTWQEVLMAHAGFRSLVEEAGEGQLHMTENEIYGTRDLEPSLAWRLFVTAKTLIPDRYGVEGDYAPVFVLRVRESGA